MIRFFLSGLELVQVLALPQSNAEPKRKARGQAGSIGHKKDIQLS